VSGDEHPEHPGPYPDATERFLVEAALEGDSRAFEAIVRRQEGTVLRVLRLMGVRASEREDVAQEVFLRVFRHLKGFDPARPLAAWVYRMTANAALDWRTQKGRERSVPIEAGHEDPAAPDVSEDSLLARRLEVALAALPDRERAVFVLKELEGLETGAVAKALGITQITVRRHLGRARDRVRAVLTEKKSDGG